LFKDTSVGPAFFTRLFGEQKVTLSGDQSQLVDWVAQGTYPVGLFLSFNEVELAAKQGLPIKAVAADQLKEAPAIGPANGAAAMMDRAPHPAAAKLYLNWLLSKEGQLLWQKDVGDNSLRTDISKDAVDPLLVPKDGVTYVDSGSETFSRAFGPNTLRQPIDEGLQKAGSK
jgi:ABC-type Fe3+ transport system substrate-binding protein